MSSPRALGADEGMTLVEVLIAAALFAVVTMGVAWVVVIATQSAFRARQHTMATVLAVERMEQLRALDWGFGDAAAPANTSDLSTDVGVVPARSGGPGLSVAPVSSLTVNTAGYADYLDGDGGWIGAGPVPPAGAAFVRRWNVARLGPVSDARVLQVVVSSSRGAAADPARPDDVRLVTVKARKAY